MSDPDTTTTSTAIVTHRLEIRSIDERKVSAVPFQVICYIIYATFRTNDALLLFYIFNAVPFNM